MSGRSVGAMANTSLPIAGRVVAITGGARGLGLATARALAVRGARVAIGDLDGDLARAEAAMLPGGPHAGYALDVTDPDQFARYLDDVEAELGALDVLVNNAGIMPVGRFAEEDPATTRRQVEINLIALMSGTRLALDRMLLRGTGVELTTIMPSLAATELAAGMKSPRFVPMVKPEHVADAIVRSLEKP